MNIIKSAGASLISLKNILLGGNLASLSLLNPKKIAFYATENLFNLDMLRQKKNVPRRSIFEVLLAKNDIQQINLGYSEAVTKSWLSSISKTSDIVNLCLICRIINPKIVFEIGTLKGYTAYHFALNTPEDSMVYTLDLPRAIDSKLKLFTTIVDDMNIRLYLNNENYCFTTTPVSKKITCLYGDSATFDYSNFKNKVDLFFIDGAHSYSYVRNDTQKALYCCHSGSIIAWHDFGRRGINGVTKWILELSKKYDIFAVPGGSLAYMIVP